jgi:tetratricopeptide (TPR) repeat protein
LNPGSISRQERGQFRTQDKVSFQNLGYDLIYSSVTYGGMSGGPVFDGDAFQWIEYGNQLYRSSKYPEAIKAFDRAIILSPTSVSAQYGKGLAFKKNKDNRSALIAFDRAIALVPANSKTQASS